VLAEKRAEVVALDARARGGVSQVPVRSLEELHEIA